MRIFVKVVAAAFLLCAPLAHAQSGTIDSGCQNSPENPTAILALVGSGGCGLVALREKLRRGK